MSAELPAGPLVCPPWCARVHPEPDNYAGEELHLSRPLRWQVLAPHASSTLEFELISYARPDGTRDPTVAQATVVDHSGRPVRQCLEITCAAEVDQAIAELERTIAALHQWRPHLPQHPPGPGEAHEGPRRPLQ